MSKKRRQYSAEFKFKIALEALKGTRSIGAIASESGVHPNQISLWKKQLQSEGPGVFAVNPDRALRELQQQEGELFEQIGRLKMELEWLKKKVG